MRIDGRDLETVRPVHSDVSILPLTHGSSLFTRGETQALVVTTLGTGLDEKYVDGLDETYKEKFMLHYNFPPYSVGETGRTGFTSRREIGHGKLAWRSLQAVLPEYDDFPYTIRLVSEITESYGSSSMATVCGSSLSFMVAGVPLKRPVAGIAMGLIKDGDRVAVLSDILGDEDHLGDMDFKVAGTSEGITSLQMDIKITGITKDIMDTALTQAKAGRIHILAEMAKAIETPRETVNSTAPRIETIQVPVDKIRDVIGSGGKVIREIVEESGAKVDINDDGIVKIASSDTESLNKALEESPGEKVLINLASNEYFKSVHSGELEFPVMTPIFLDRKDGGDYKTVSFYAKRARGSMASWIIRNRISQSEQFEEFGENGYEFCSERSNNQSPVFIRTNS